MSRLIDADALLELYDGCEGLHVPVEVVIQNIKDMPTIEAEPVRHGHWNSITNCSNAGVYCSVCRKKVWKEDYAWCNRKNKLRSDYCPHCGAKMDKEECDEVCSSVRIDHWMKIYNDYGELESFIHKECGRTSAEASNYCPSCGTKMYTEN